MKEKVTSTLTLIFLLHSLVTVAQQFPYSVAPIEDQHNNIRFYLNHVASNITTNSLSSIGSLQDWETVRDQRHQELIEMLGLQGKPVSGERPAVKVTKTGVIQKDGYRIEKLYYESLPGLYVAANLYVPDDIKKKAPAILYVCGHAHNQKYNYQAHAKSFAQNGFVCLIIETIQRGEVKGEHLGVYELGWFQWYSQGYNPAGVEVWNGIRGLDLLCQMPEVDQDKLGVTGISGGGSQSWYLPAIDRRIKAAAAVAGAGSLEGQICQRTIDDHCDCMMPINTYSIDFSDVGAQIAPRPFMIAQTNRDLYYSIEAVRTLYDKIKPIYNYYGAPENIRMEEAGGGHSYGSNEEFRPVILSFFLKELMGKEVSAESIGTVDIEKELPVEALTAYVEGPPADDRTKTIQDTFVNLAKAPEITSIEQLNNYRKEVLDFLKDKTFGAFPKQPAPLDIRLEFQANRGRQDYSFVPEEGWRLKLSLRRNYPENGKTPVLLVLKSPNEEQWASLSMTYGVQGKVAIFEARGIGETGWAPSLQWYVRRSSAWTGRTVASMRVYDLLRCLEALREIPGVDPDKIRIAARGEMTAVASYAALLDGNVQTLILKDPPATQNAPSQPDGTGESIEMLNCLQITDLPQVTGLHFPKEVVAIGELPSSYHWAESLYKNLNEPGSFIKVAKLSEWGSDL
ncbi:MAG: hypothetical protein DHS20C17_21290 [Cyclobacteriaceae bacterium]|nr:MAG: hypothetical protein DHS20C17_21290 [Cyclobacteriaceae bacterium]